MQTTQITSIYKKTDGVSLADLLKEFDYNEAQGQQGGTSKYNPLKEKLNSYLGGLDYTREIPLDKDIPQIISNAMILERFKVEAIEIIGKNENLNNEQRKQVLEVIFGEKSEYKKLYDKYYAPNGLVEKAQKFFKEKEVVPIFKHVVPICLSSDSFDLTKDVFKAIDDMKKGMHLETNHSKSFVISTTAFDKNDLNLTIMGLLASDPRELGATLAVMGNKEKEGEIIMEKDQRYKFGRESLKGWGNAAVRCLIVLAICVAFLYLASVGTAFASVGVASISTKTVVGATASLIVGMKGFDYIRTTVEKEKPLTREITTSSVNTNAAGSGISTDDLYKFIVAPITKGGIDDERKSFTGFEQKLLETQSAISENKSICHNFVRGNKTRMETIINEKQYISVVKSFGISIKGLEIAK